MKEGIPAYRENSHEWKKWWELQVDRCINGYKPSNGKKISGKYYFYLNFVNILGDSGGGGRKGVINPWYRDLDHEYFDLLEKCKTEGKGLIVLKARDKGFSYMNCGILLHEWLFYPHSESGVGAQTEDYVTAIKTKITRMRNMLPKEMRASILKDNRDVLLSGYIEKERGQWIEKGTKSAIYFRPVRNPDVFRGERLVFCLFDEAGEINELMRTIMATQACFMDGAIQFGVPIIGGTNNTMKRGSNDFNELFYNADKYNLEKFFVPATKVYHGFFDLKTGVSDVEGAEADVMSKRDRLKGGNDKSAYYLHIQEYPVTPEEAFMMGNGLYFDIDKLNEQKANIMANESVQNMVQRGTLSWETGADGQKKVVWNQDPDGKIKILYHPKPELKNLDIGGVDSYTQAEAPTSDSKGCCVIYRRFVSMDEPCEMPILEYTDRPYDKEEFYETCLKIAMYYNCKLLTEYTDEAFFKYFEKMNAFKYLKERPKAADSPWSKAVNKFGVHMKTYHKNLLIDLLDEYIKKSSDQIFFMDLIDDLLNFGVKNTDRAMAFGMCLIHDLDNVNLRILDEKQQEEKPDFFPYYEYYDGKVVSVLRNQLNRKDIYKL